MLARNVITPALASWSLRSELLAKSFTVPSPYTMASVSVRGSAVERRSVRGPMEGRGKGGEGGEGGAKGDRKMRGEKEEEDGGRRGERGEVGNMKMRGEKARGRREGEEG